MHASRRFCVVVATFVVFFALGSMTSSMAADGSISGVVTASGGGPLAGACVEIFQQDTGFDQIISTNASGEYSFTGLAAGDYKIKFSGCDAGEYIAEWYQNAATSDVATPITVADGQNVTGIDASLDFGGSVNGRLTDSSGAPIANECVTVFGPFSIGTRSAADGTYHIGSLPTADYHVDFAGCGASPYIEEWYNDKPSEDLADAVAVTQGQATTGIDAVLASAGGISGTVTDEAGNPLSGICVDVSSPRDVELNAVQTDAHGSYHFNVAAGTYYVGFGCSIHGAYEPEWWNNQPDRNSSDPIVVSEGQSVTGIDAALAQVTGAIAGIVTDTDGHPVTFACVDAYSTAGAVTGSSPTGSDGRYYIGDLAPADYKVLFRDCSNERRIVREWFDNQPTFAAADLVNVPARLVRRADAMLVVCADPRDRDHDGLRGCDEAKIGTDPSDPDTDGDLFGDGFEVNGGRCFGVRFTGGSDPTDALSVPPVPFKPHTDLRIPNPVGPICR